MMMKSLGAALLIAIFMEAAVAEPALPRCIDAASDIAAIAAVQKENRKTPLKYDGYRRLLESATDLELAARLVYAETLAANCPDQNGRVAELVTAVVGNRIRIRRGDGRSVVWQRDQFSSSLNIYPESRYRDFLCPRDGTLWQDVLAKMRVDLEGSAPAGAVPEDAVNYYLYLHSDRFKAPAWQLAEIPINDEKTRQCIRVFRAPGWK
jgi:hypothetical protein